VHPDLALVAAADVDFAPRIVDRDALDAAVERRKQADRNEDGLAAQLQALGVDRTRLAAALDGETARSRRLETTNREIAERLDSAIATIQSVLDVHE